MRKIITAFLTSAALALSPALAAGPNFLWSPGTSNNGEIASNLTLLTTELNALANGSVAVSSVGGATGLFSNAAAGTNQAIWGEVFVTLGATGVACSAGANVSGWFLQTPDGTTLEPTGAAPARAPDFVVPLPATTLNATYKAAGVVRLPALKFKVMLQNNCGQALNATGNSVLTTLTAVQY